MRALPVNKRRREDMDELSTAPASAWTALFHELGSLGQAVLTIEELTTLFEKHFGSKHAKILSGTAISLRRWADEKNMSADTVVASLLMGLREAGWADDKISQSQEFADRLRELIGFGVVRLTAKSSDLYYRNGWHLHDIKIVTDIRPVFDVPRDNIVGMIARNILYVVYSDSFENERVVEIAIGEDALERLQSEVSNALKKSKKIDTEIANPLKLPCRHYRSDWN